MPSFEFGVDGVCPSFYIQNHADNAKYKKIDNGYKTYLKIVDSAENIVGIK